MVRNVVLIRREETSIPYRRPLPYVRDPDDESEVDAEKVQALVAERAVARLEQNWDRADAIRLTLHRDHNVRCNDRYRVWRGDGQLYSMMEHYARDPTDGSRLVNETMVAELVARRARLRRRRDMEAADAALDELLGLGVIPDDARRTWRHVGLPIYRRSPDETDRIVDEGVVEALLLKRLKARLRNDFVEADAILDDLMTARVSVSDEKRRWRLVTVRGKGGPGRRNATRILELLRDRTQARRRRDFETADRLLERLRSLGVRVVVDRARDFSARCDPRWCGYARAADDTRPGVDQVVVQDMLLERVEARRRCDFAEADRVLSRLNRLGVAVDDKLKVWRFVGYEITPDAPYVFVGDNHDDDDLTEGGLVAECAKLVADRDRARAFGDFVEADRVRNELRRRHVQVDDSTRSWTLATTDFSKKLGGYVRDPADRAPGVDVERVQALLLERSTARRKMKFNKSDKILQELYDMGVIVSDETKRWKYLGEPFTPRQRPSAFSRDPADDEPLPDALDPAAVTDLCNTRLDARRKSRWQHADDLLDRLNGLGCVVEDRNRTWKFVGNLVAPASDVPPEKLAVTNLTHVNYLLARRQRYRRWKQYDKAKRVTDVLRLEFQITVTDKNRTWHFADSTPAATAPDDDRPASVLPPPTRDRLLLDDYAAPAETGSRVDRANDPPPARGAGDVGPPADVASSS